MYYTPHNSSQLAKNLFKLDFDMSLTGFDPGEIDDLLALVDKKANAAPPLPESPVSRPGDLWLLGQHRYFAATQRLPKQWHGYSANARRG